MTLRTDPEKVKAWRARSKQIERKPFVAKSRKPIPLRSRNRDSFDRDFDAAKRVVRIRSNGQCEARFPGCTKLGTLFHHAAGRVGPGCNHPDRVVHACDSCHRYGHAHPTESYETGFMVRRVS